MELTDEDLFVRCGTKLKKEKVQKILTEFKYNADRRNKITGTPDIGSDINGYEIVGYLGSGGFGTVCLAKKKGLYFALKFMLINTKQNGPDKEFNILYEFLTSDSHEKFLTAFEWKEWNDFDDEDVHEDLKFWKKKLCYIVMKLVGPSLQMLMEQQEKCVFPINLGVPIMQNTLIALQLFHERKYVHHDLKLENFAIDINDETHVLLLDYGMGNRAPHQNKDKNGFKGTRQYASRRALECQTLSYRDDCESWLYCLYRFLFGELVKPHIVDPMEEKRKFWSPGNVHNQHIIKIMKHIDFLGFQETMNFKFIQECLQDLIDEDAGIPYVPYLYKMSERKCMQIVKANFKYNARDPEKKKLRTRFICSHSSCNFAIFVETTEYEKSQADDEAIIIDNNDQHICSTF